MKKILILYTSVGLGHKTIAENIGWQLTSEGFEVKLADVGNVQQGKFASCVMVVHRLINLYLPAVWAWLYAWGYVVLYPFRMTVAGKNCEQVKNLIAEFQPEVIITTQTTASATVAYLKRTGAYKKLFGIAFSDYHFHPFWFYRPADFYLVNIPEQKSELVDRGVPANKIFVCGMSLRPQLPIDVDKVRQELGIKPREKIVLLGSGSLGSGLSEELLARLAESQNFKVVAVCGKNCELQKKLQREYSNICVLGFYQPMAKLYAVADIFLSKPGGLSVAESLSNNLPLIVTHILPGQEKLNLKYLLRRHLVLPAAKDIIAQINHELTTGEFKRSLQTNPDRQALLNPNHTAVQAVREMIHDN